MQSDKDAADLVFAREDVTDSRDSGADLAAPETPGQPRDDQGRFAPKSEPAPATPPVEAAPQAEVLPPEPTPEPARMVPLPELMGERTKRQEAERRAAEYAAKVEAYERSLQYTQPRPQAQPQHQPMPQMPDMFADPEGCAAYQSEQQHFRVRNQIADMSEAIARRLEGDEIVDKATKWAIEAGIGQHFLMRARDPYGELISAYKRQEAMSRIGPDPNAYEERIRKEEREKVLAELKAGQPKPTFPGSLANATPTGNQGAHISPQAAADSVFARRGG